MATLSVATRREAFKRVKRPRGDQRGANELDGSGRERGCQGRGKVHSGDLLGEFPRSAVLKVGQTPLQFVPPVDVEDHEASGDPENEIPENCRGTFQVRIQ